MTERIMAILANRYPDWTPLSYAGFAITLAARPGWYTKDVCILWRVTGQTVWRWTRDGLLPHTKVGGRLQFRPADVLAFVPPFERQRAVTPAEREAILASSDSIAALARRYKVAWRTIKRIRSESEGGPL